MPHSLYICLFLCFWAFFAYLYLDRFVFEGRLRLLLGRPFRGLWAQLRRVSCRIFSTVPSEDCPVNPTIPAPPPDDFIDHQTYAVGPERPGTDTAEKAVSSDTGNATFAQEQQRQALTNGIGAPSGTLAQNDSLPANQQKAEDHAKNGERPTWDNLPTDSSLPEGCIYANDPDDEDTPALRSLKELKKRIAEKMIAAFAQEREATTYYPDADKSL